MSWDSRVTFGAAKVVSRRAFLEISSVAAGTGVVGLESAMITTHAEAQTAPPPQGAQTLDIALSVNGVDRPLKVEARATLAEVLRGPLHLTGTKISCNRGACSACTVWLDGEPVCSCMTLAIDVGARRVTTIEGLAKGDELHPVQEAFIAHDAMQCGFCTPGMAMAAAALLAHNADPSPDDVKAGIGGHICRCGTYPHVVEATLAAAKAKRL